MDATDNGSITMGIGVQSVVNKGTMGGSFDQSTTSKQPSLTTINGVQALGFSQSLLTGLAGAATITAPYTISALYQVTAAGGFRVLSSKSANWFVGPYNSKWAVYQGGWTQNSGVHDTVPVIVTVTDTGTVTDIYINGAVSTSYPTSPPTSYNSSLRANAGLLAFGSGGFFAQSFNGAVGDLIVASDVASRADQESYLASKYGVTI